jgi:hypothetical protein
MSFSWGWTADSIDTSNKLLTYKVDLVKLLQWKPATDYGFDSDGRWKRSFAIEQLKVKRYAKVIKYSDI